MWQFSLMPAHLLALSSQMLSLKFYVTAAQMYDIVDGCHALPLYFGHMTSQVSGITHPRPFVVFDATNGLTCHGLQIMSHLLSWHCSSHCHTPLQYYREPGDNSGTPGSSSQSCRSSTKDVAVSLAFQDNFYPLWVFDDH